MDLTISRTYPHYKEGKSYFAATFCFINPQRDQLTYYFYSCTFRLQVSWRRPLLWRLQQSNVIWPPIVPFVRTTQGGPPLSRWWNDSGTSRKNWVLLWNCCRSFQTIWRLHTYGMPLNLWKSLTASLSCFFESWEIMISSWKTILILLLTISVTMRWLLRTSSSRKLWWELRAACLSLMSRKPLWFLF